MFFNACRFFYASESFIYFWEKWWPDTLNFIHLCVLNTFVIPEAKQMQDKGWSMNESSLSFSLDYRQGNPFQCSCLENPRDGGTWWAAICGVTQSQTRLDWVCLVWISLVTHTWASSLKVLWLSFSTCKMGIILDWTRNKWRKTKTNWKHLYCL